MNRKRHNPALPAGELELLRRIRLRAGSGRAPLALGIGDDCALLQAKPGEQTAVTTDLSIEGRHFRLDSHPPEAIGHRAAARGLSDLAAMGARPLAAFLSLALPAELTTPARGGKPWIDRFYDGLLALLQAHKTPLAGGDLAQSPLVVADIVLVGAVPAGTALLRSGTRPGDLVYVTGALGGSAVGLERLKTIANKQSGRSDKIAGRLESVLRPHFYPQPRVAQGLWLQTRAIASAAIDLSDGLSTDLAHLCEESSVAAELEAAALPMAPDATLDQALNGGEDYELLFTARPAVRLPRMILGVPITRIGHTLRRRPGSPQILLRTAAGLQPLDPRGWKHFSQK